MKNWLYLLVCLVSCSANAQSFINPHGLEKRDSSPEYASVVSFYKNLANNDEHVRVKTLGPTDTDEPLLAVYYTPDAQFNEKVWKEEERIVILVNNGIHPGEPDGIVASMQLLWDVSNNKVLMPANVVLVVIPTFNISGAQRLRAYSRANQDGPTITGFRGNAQNLDLNRDFTKMDARETRTLARFFRLVEPDILIDNHVSNGADYQHVMTLLSTQHNKLGGPMGEYLEGQFEPALYADMKNRGYDLVPYVNVWGRSPGAGWQTYLETARYLSGYAALFNTYAFVAETHMLKPFADRVDATYKLMQSVIKYAADSSARIKSTRLAQKQWIASADSMAIEWTVDTTRHKMVELKGYRAGTATSLVSGQPRLFYDRTRPYTKEVPFYGFCEAVNTVAVPKAYVMYKGWNKVIKRLEQNGVEIIEVQHDTTLAVTVYHVKDYETVDKPYEGHYLHSNIEVTTSVQNINLVKGDYIIPVNQSAKRYIIEVLEPTAPDGFLAWGFFDAVLQQKEYYSAYVFEDLAAKMLIEDTTLKNKFEAYKTAHPELANDGRALLHFVYQNSRFHEPEHLRYPVYRLE